eukprot:TRINITY_DN8698_c0_g1_i4.p3 TRINITY_DN8698_c0_g1~~TRINITY_DN8698_c0_g1_i4.p3  ORF type:complete len:200 (-),score=-1.87 TRINITY_DN8698_c0_g1_i4:4-603(-)
MPFLADPAPEELLPSGREVRRVIVRQHAEVHVTDGNKSCRHGPPAPALVPDIIIVQEEAVDLFVLPHHRDNAIDAHDPGTGMAHRVRTEIDPDTVRTVCGIHDEEAAEGEAVVVIDERDGADDLPLVFCAEETVRIDRPEAFRVPEPRVPALAVGPCHGRLNLFPRHCPELHALHLFRLLPGYWQENYIPVTVRPCTLR